MRAWWWLVGLAWAGGWRGDGTASFPSARLDAGWEAASLRWSVSAPARGNGSLVRFGGLVCGTAEPATLFCLDAASGALRWRAESSYADVLPAGEQPAARLRLQEAEAAEEALRSARLAYSQLQREARKADAPPGLFTQLGVIAADMDRHKRVIDAAASVRAGPVDGTIGHASPTPAASSEVICALFGFGALSCFDAQGARLWSRWLGPAGVRMRGYHEGQAASPLVVGELLIVPQGRLRAYEIGTGALRWEGPEYADYGTPAVLGGVIATPAGELVRASDGVVVQRGLGDVWYTGPAAHGQELLYLGGRIDAHDQGTHSLEAAAWTVGSSGSASARWKVSLPVNERVYAPAVWAGGRWFAVTRDRTLLVISAEDGRLLHQRRLAELQGELWTSLVVAGDRLLVTSDRGELLVLAATAEAAVLSKGRVEPLRAMPLPEGQDWFVRGYERVQRWRLGR